MSEQVSRAFRGSISVLLFGALAAGGVSFGYLAATSSDEASLTSQVDTRQAPAEDRQTTGGLLARMAPVVR